MKSRPELDWCRHWWRKRDYWGYGMCRRCRRRAAWRDFTRGGEQEHR